MKLNLGCGNKHLPGYLNVDSQPPYDQYVDLNQYPWPWGNDSADEIVIEHCLEHLNDPLKAVNELHRIIKSGKTINVKVPHYSQGGNNFTHKSFWSVESFNFDTLTKNKFVVVTRHLKWLRYGYKQRKAYYPLIFIAPVVDWLANLNPFICERFWCYWVGGFEEIEFKLTKMV